MNLDRLKTALAGIEHLTMSAPDGKTIEDEELPSGLKPSILTALADARAAINEEEPAAPVGAGNGSTMIRAVLFNKGDVRLGEVDVSQDCRIIAFGGAYFASTGQEALLDAGGLGQVFDESYVYVRTDLDKFDPRKVER